MRIIETKAYTFDELSNEAKENAIQKERESKWNNGYAQFYYDEAYESVKAFLEMTNLKTYNSWLDFRTSHIEDDIVNLSGLRLRTYVINNYWNYLYDGKFRNSIGENKVINHKRIKTNYYDVNKGALCSSSNFYYSGIFLECSCPFTGVCWDMDLVYPMLELINNYKPEKHNNYDFEDLMNDCANSLKKSLEGEEEYLYSDECISEDLVNNEYEFDENGNMI